MRGLAKVKSIRTEADYQAALGRIEQLWDAPDGTPEGDELDALVDLVERYEDKHEPMGYSTPIGAIEFLIDQEGNLPRYLGTATEVADVLAGFGPVTSRMARELHERLGIPYGSMLPRNSSKADTATDRAPEVTPRSRRGEG